MLSRLRYLSFKPKDLRCLCDQERWLEKIKLACIALSLCAIASSVAYYFDNLVYRSYQFQQAALSGDKEFKFLDYQHF